MDGHNYLGIYLSKIAATVVCLGSVSKAPVVLGYFSVGLEEQKDDQGQGGFVKLAELAAQGCAERGFEFGDVAVALDCAMVMQHEVHSEFTDVKQIAATIRFDTEEALASDVTNFAIGFRINSTDENGSDLTVFTVDKEVLSQILSALQANKLDPVVIEPDVNSLAGFVGHNLGSGQSEQVGTIYTMLSAKRGYFILGAGGDSVKMRTFLIGRNRSRAEVLAGQIPLTAALLGGGESITALKVSGVDSEQLSSRLGISAEEINLVKSAGLEQDSLDDCGEPVEFAIAYGAALASLEKIQTSNFRSSFMPYQGTRVRLEKLLKHAAIAAFILVILLGGYLQYTLIKKTEPVRRLRKKFNQDYAAVMYNKKPSGRLDPVKKLGSELRRIESIRSGQLSITGKKPVSAKLTMVLNAFNKCAKEIDLKIDSVSITAKAISIAGNTSSRSGTLKLRSAMEQSNLKIVQDNLELKAGRDNFRITVVPKE